MKESRWEVSDQDRSDGTQISENSIRGTIVINPQNVSDMELLYRTCHCRILMYDFSHIWQKI